MTGAVRRALTVFVVTQALALLTLWCIAAALAVPTALFDTGLLLGSTLLLGNVWALREHLQHAARAPLLAALIPCLTMVVLMIPRATRGMPPDALLTLTVSLAAVGPTEHVWSAWVTGRPPSPLAHGVRMSAPALAGASMLLVVSPGAQGLLLAAVSSASGLALGFWFWRRAARADRAEEVFARFVDRVEVGADALRIPPLPPTPDARLRALDATLRRRSRELAADAAAAQRAKMDIEDARQLRSRFMASMSHELRSPLNSIVGFGQILEDGIDGELMPAQLESVLMIKRAAEELILLLTDTLDLARLEAGKLRLRFEWVPSVEILTEAVRRGRAIVEGRDVEIEAELQPGLPPVYADRDRIVQAVVALFRHAAASMQKTTVRLRARAALGPPGPAHQLRVEFYDAVGALPEEEVERIFEAFREIAAPAGRRVGGLGMALSLSRSLVRLHGGDVWADGVQGAGTILCVALPLDGDQTKP